MVAGLSVTGRPLAAANAVLALPDEPVQRLWQLTTTLREHRGDGHVAAIVAERLSGLDAHLLHVAAGDATWGSRGWTEEEREAAEAALRERGLLDRVGGLSAAGLAARAAVEERTDAASWAGGVSALDDDGVDAVVDAMRAMTSAAERLLWYPNPIGLPASR
jgi:hypothetical protein